MNSTTRIGEFVIEHVTAIATLLVLSVVFLTLIVVNVAFVPSFWLDELFTVTLIQRPYDRIIETVIVDGNPPLYFLLLKVWSSFGDYSELHLRSLSAIFAAISVITVYLMRKRMDKLTFVIFMSLILFNGLFLHHSQEARPYSLLFMLSTILVSLVYQFDKSSSRLWPIFAVGTAMSLVHYFGLLFVVLTYAVLALEYRKQLAKLAQIAVAGLVANSWVIFQIFQGALGNKVGGGNYFRFEVDGPLGTLSVAACASVSAVCHASRIAPTLLVGGVLAFLIVLAILKWFPWQDVRKEKYSGPARLTIIVVAFVACIMVIDSVVPISRHYRFIVLLPPVYLLISIFSADLFRANTVLAKVALVLFGAFIFLQAEQGAKHAYMKVKKPENWQKLTDIVLSEARADEIIFFYDNSTSEFYSSWKDNVYNFYIDRISNGGRKALPMKLDEINNVDLPYILMFCHIRKDQFEELVREFERTFDVGPGFVQNSHRYPDVCGMIHVRESDQEERRGERHARGQSLPAAASLP